MKKTARKNIIKRIVDLLLTLLLLLLMAYQVTGEALHEWLGIAMTAVLIVHHVLNYADIYVLKIILGCAEDLYSVFTFIHDCSPRLLFHLSLSA